MGSYIYIEFSPNFFFMYISYLFVFFHKVASKCETISTSKIDENFGQTLLVGCHYWATMLANTNANVMLIIFVIHIFKFLHL